MFGLTIVIVFAHVVYAVPILVRSVSTGHLGPFSLAPHLAAVQATPELHHPRRCLQGRLRALVVLLQGHLHGHHL